MKTIDNCAWCGCTLIVARSEAGQGADLLCSRECGKLYWAWMDSIDVVPPKSIEERLEDAEDFFRELDLEDDLARRRAAKIS